MAVMAMAMTRQPSQDSSLHRFALLCHQGSVTSGPMVTPQPDRASTASGLSCHPLRSMMLARGLLTGPCSAEQTHPEERRGSLQPCSRSRRGHMHNNTGAQPSWEQFYISRAPPYSPSASRRLRHPMRKLFHTPYQLCTYTTEKHSQAQKDITYLKRPRTTRHRVGDGCGPEPN